MTGRLFTPPPVDEATLSDRQRFALQELRQNPAGLNSEQVGRALHDHTQPKHSASCTYCSPAGTYVLRQLKEFGLVRLRKGGRWQAVGAQPAQVDDGRYDPAKGAIPF